jgi:hypothetical protein
MITLNIDPWCHECAAFHPSCKSSVLFGDEEQIKVVHTISCSNKEICDAIKRTPGLRSSRYGEEDN